MHSMQDFLTNHVLSHRHKKSIVKDRLVYFTAQQTEATKSKCHRFCFLSIWHY